MIAAIATATGLKLVRTARGGGVARKDRSGFGIAPGRFLVTDDRRDWRPRLADAVTDDIGTITDLSHGRTAIRIAGPKAEWVLSKLFAVDFWL